MGVDVGLYLGVLERDVAECQTWYRHRGRSAELERIHHSVLAEQFWAGEVDFIDKGRTPDFSDSRILQDKGGEHGQVVKVSHIVLVEEAAQQGKGIAQLKAFWEHGTGAKAEMNEILVVCLRHADCKGVLEGGRTDADSLGIVVFQNTGEGRHPEPAEWLEGGLHAEEGACGGIEHQAAASGSGGPVSLEPSCPNKDGIVKEGYSHLPVHLVAKGNPLGPLVESAGRNVFALEDGAVPVLLVGIGEKCQWLAVHFIRNILVFSQGVYISVFKSLVERIGCSQCLPWGAHESAACGEIPGEGGAHVAAYKGKSPVVRSPHKILVLEFIGDRSHGLPGHSGVEGHGDARLGGVLPVSFTLEPAPALLVFKGS